MLQFTIPFINQNIVRQGTSQPVQNPLYISLGVHGGSIACDDLNKKACDYTVPAYEKHETIRYEIDDWKVIHSIPIYNKDNGVYEVNDKHITLRLEMDLQRVLAARSLNTLPYQIYRFHNTRSLASLILMLFN